MRSIPTKRPCISTVKAPFVLDGDHASEVTYCTAHHVTVDGSVRRLMVAAIRYLDTYVKHDGAWFFSQRKLMVDWTETRPLATG
jgi:SnoaL-like domain